MHITTLESMPKAAIFHKQPIIRI